MSGHGVCYIRAGLGTAGRGGWRLREGVRTLCATEKGIQLLMAAMLPHVVMALPRPAAKAANALHAPIAEVEHALTELDAPIVDLERAPTAPPGTASAPM